MIDMTAAASQIRALAPEQLSLLVLRLREQVRIRAAAPPPLPSASNEVAVDELTDAAVDEMLAQMLAAGGGADAALAANAPESRRASAGQVEVEQLSDDEVNAMLTALLQEESE